MPAPRDDDDDDDVERALLASQSGCSRAVGELRAAAAQLGEGEHSIAGVLEEMARVPARLAPATSSLARARALRDDLELLRRNSKRALALFGGSLRAAGAALPALLEWNALSAKAHKRDVDALRTDRRGFRVLLRVRPALSDVERASGVAVRNLDAKSCAFRDSDEASRGGGSYAGSARRGDGATGAWRAFAFDRVFGPNAGQRDVYDALEGLAPRVARGGHVALLAYGQTGSGKTFSMQGAQSRPGVSARLLRRLCALVKAKGAASTLSLAMVEIYNESLIDLLGNGGSTPVSVLLFTVTLHANHAHNLTRSP